MKAFNICATIMIAVLSLTACKKNDDNNNNPQSATIIGSWTPTAIKSDKPYEWESGVVGTDGYTYHAACVSKSYITFNQGGNAQSGTGSTYDDCDKAQGQFTWLLQSNLLTVDGSEDRTIEKLDGSTLIISYVVDVSGQDVKITDTYKRK